MPTGIYEHKKTPPAERFWKKVSLSENGCWIWLGTKNDKGYGQISIDGKHVYAHRFSYEHHIGKIQNGLEIDHRCRTPLCVNPGHLEPVTHAENLRRKPAKTHCKRGHAMSAENTYTSPNGWRECRACRQSNFKGWYERTK